MRDWAGLRDDVQAWKASRQELVGMIEGPGGWRKICDDLKEKNKKQAAELARVKGELQRAREHLVGYKGVVAHGNGSLSALEAQRGYLVKLLFRKGSVKPVRDEAELIRVLNEVGRDAYLKTLVDNGGYKTDDKGRFVLDETYKTSDGKLFCVYDGPIAPASKAMFAA